MLKLFKQRYSNLFKKRPKFKILMKIKKKMKGKKNNKQKLQKIHNKAKKDQ